MHRKVSVLGKSLLALACMVGLVAIGCSDPEEEARLAKEAAQAEVWTAVEAAKGKVESLRGELAEVKESIQQGAQEGAEATEEQLAEWKERAKGLEEQVISAGEEFNSQLINYINGAELEQGQEPPEGVKAALRMKSDEDILIAREYIDKGGDYSRAIEIYNGALAADPDYQRLNDEIAWAEEQRWMSKERFDQAKKGMTRDQIREVLGPVNNRMIQDYPERNVIAWFYPKGPSEGAAGVYYETKGSGEPKVYKVDFNAVKPKE